MYTQNGQNLMKICTEVPLNMPKLLLKSELHLSISWTRRREKVMESESSWEVPQSHLLRIPPNAKKPHRNHQRWFLWGSTVESEISQSVGTQVDQGAGVFQGARKEDTLTLSVTASEYSWKIPALLQGTERDTHSDTQTENTSFLTLEHIKIEFS